LRLLVVGLIALPFHIMALTIPIGGGNPMGYPFINIMFTIALSLMVLRLYDKIKIRVLFWLLYIIVIVPISFLFFKWYFVGVTMVLMHHIIKNETARRIVPSIFAAVCFLLLAAFTVINAPLMQAAMEAGINIFPPNALVAKPEFAHIMLIFPLGILLAGFLLKNYNGERGKKSKWLFYVIYPLHFVVLLAIGFATGALNLSMFGF